MTDTSVVIESPKAKVRVYSEYMDFNNSEFFFSFSFMPHSTSLPPYRVYLKNQIWIIKIIKNRHQW